MSDRDEVLTREQAKLKKLAKLLDEGGGINPAVTMNEAAAVIRAVALRAPTLPTTAAPVSDGGGDRKLTMPAQIGNGIFSAGVSERLVIERAQREYEYRNTPEKEAERMNSIERKRLLVRDLMEESDQCRNDGANAIANLIDRAINEIDPLTAIALKAESPK